MNRREKPAAAGRNAAGNPRAGPSDEDASIEAHLRTGSVTASGTIAGNRSRSFQDLRVSEALKYLDALLTTGKVETDGTAALMKRTYALMKERAIDIRRLRLAAICTVCVKPFLKEVNQMADLLKSIGFVKNEITTHATD